MGNNAIEIVTQMLVQEEGFRGVVYKDGEGYATIGYGRNLDTNPLTEEEGMYLLKSCLPGIANQCSQFTFWGKLSDNRQAVVLDMAFNLGYGGIVKFKNMIAAMALGDYGTAAVEMKNSKWYGQVKAGRGDKLIKMMIKG